MEDILLHAVAPVAALMVAMIVPIALIFTKHQQKMALILAQKDRSQDSPRLEAQMAELQQLVCAQSYAIDNLAKSVADLRTTTLQERESVKMLSS